MDVGETGQAGGNYGGIREMVKVGDRIWHKWYENPHTVIGETRISWIVRSAARFKHYGTRINLPGWNLKGDEKINKKKPGENWFFTEAEHAEFRWAYDNKYAISNLFECAATPEQIRRVATMLDYREPTRR